MIEDSVLARQMKTVLDSLATNREKLHVISELTEDDLVA